MLKLLSKIYSQVINCRNWLYDRNYLSSYSINLPIICVGNVLVGGSGKTPLVIFLAQHFQAQGYQPVILTRGYGGKFKGPIQITGTEHFSDTGDEALLIADKTKLPVVIAKSRYLGAKLIEDQKLGNLIIMDDGFQHRQLKRSINLLCIENTDSVIQEVVDNKLLPLGRMREPLTSALARATHIVLTSRGNVSAKPELVTSLTRLVPNLPVLKTSFKILSPTHIITQEKISNNNIYIFSGIANPLGFKSAILSLGFNIIGEKFFSDHYDFAEADLVNLKKLAENACLVCTEKDAVKLKQIRSIEKYRIYALPITCQIDKSELSLITI